ncbi:hypothetical protein Barb6_03567 [Bacteroidales bacterium Barb6]|nr:hypothetical protein Barb6_03567 [Bacteroidales bacterium Barb6]
MYYLRLLYTVFGISVCFAIITVPDELWCFFMTVVPDEL